MVFQDCTAVKSRLRHADVFLSVGVAALVSELTVTLHERLTKRSLEKLRSVAQLAFAMSIRALGTHLALVESELLANLGLLEIWRVLELVLAMSERALITFCAMTLRLAICSY